MESQVKFSVVFFQENNTVKIVDLTDDVQAVQFAINLHRSSNVTHSIFVYEGAKSDPIVTFSLK